MAGVIVRDTGGLLRLKRAPVGDFAAGKRTGGGRALALGSCTNVVICGRCPRGGTVRGSGARPWRRRCFSNNEEEAEVGSKMPHGLGKRGL